MITDSQRIISFILQLFYSELKVSSLRLQHKGICKRFYFKLLLQGYAYWKYLVYENKVSGSYLNFSKMFEHSSSKTQLWLNWTYYGVILNVYFIGLHIYFFIILESMLVLTELSKHRSKSVRSWNPAKAWCCEALYKALSASRSLRILWNLCLQPSELLYYYCYYFDRCYLQCRMKIE